MLVFCAAGRGNPLFAGHTEVQVGQNNALQAANRRPKSGRKTSNENHDSRQCNNVGTQLVRENIKPHSSKHARVCGVELAGVAVGI